MIKYLSILAVILFLYLLFSSTVHAKTNNGISIIRDELRAQGLNESDVEVMYNIMLCESGGDPFAQNPNSSAAGLFAITKSTFLANSPYSWEDRYDWLVSLETAVIIYHHRGFQPWQASAKCWQPM